MRSVSRQKRTTAKPAAKIKPTKLRVIGGHLRGRSVAYLGDRITRPMKESLREALFNIIGPSIAGRIAWDLFAGTGMLAIESLSRGAHRAIAVESHRRVAAVIRTSATAIGVTAEQLEVITGDSFRVGLRRMAEVAEETPVATWLVFFSPPYAMWHETPAQMHQLVQSVAAVAPPGSLLVTEMDKFYDPASLPLGCWDVRRKGNMTLALLETGLPPEH